MTLGDASTNVTFIFAPWNKINYFTVLKHLYLNTLLSLHLHQANQKTKVFVLKFSGLGLIFPMRSDSRETSNPWNQFG